jgi:hypothetical protein
MDLKSLINQFSDKLKPYLMDDETVVTPESGEETTAAATKRKYSARDVTAALFNGMGVGLLLGLLLGLAVSPVVSGVIGTLSSLLVVLLGLNEKLFTVVKSVRIGAFGLFAVVGILAGLYIRSHSPLAPSMADLKKEYTDLGYPDSVARDFIAYQEFGLIPESWKGRIAVTTTTPPASDSVAEGEEAATQQFANAQTVNMATRKNILFSSKVNAGQCYMLQSSDESMTLDDIRMNMEAAGGTWEELANDLDPELPEEVRKKILLIAIDAICSSGNSGTVEFDCSKLGDISADTDLSMMVAQLKDSGEPWSTVTNSVLSEIDPKHQSKTFLSLLNIFCHE